jgi:hypothetical protein
MTETRLQTTPCPFASVSSVQFSRKFAVVPRSRRNADPSQQWNAPRERSRAREIGQLVVGDVSPAPSIWKNGYFDSHVLVIDRALRPCERGFDTQRTCSQKWQLWCAFEGITKGTIWVSNGSLQYRDTCRVRTSTLMGGSVQGSTKYAPRQPLAPPHGAFVHTSAYYTYPGPGSESLAGRHSSHGTAESVAGEQCRVTFW